MTGHCPSCTGVRGCLLDRQAERHRQATSIITRLNAIARLRTLGEPKLCGAVAYGLLVAPDIDIEVFGALDLKAGFSVIAGLATNRAVRKVTFINAIGEDDAGLGWEILYLDRGTNWRLQTWLLPHDYDGPRSSDLVPAMRKALDDARRCVILRIKEDLVLRDRPYRSIDVYRAVLDHGVATPAEYGRWVRSHASTGLIDWLPSFR